jgi:hypothetical protein
VHLLRQTKGLEHIKESNVIKFKSRALTNPAFWTSAFALHGLQLSDDAIQRLLGIRLTLSATYDDVLFALPDAKAFAKSVASSRASASSASPASSDAPDLDLDEAEPFDFLIAGSGGAIINE